MSGPQGIEFEAVTAFFQAVVLEDRFWKNAKAGQIRMDLRPGRTRVHEHAETG
jgi:hypothetical protein